VRPKTKQGEGIVNVWRLPSAKYLDILSPFSRDHAMALSLTKTIFDINTYMV
jgi:hypothetical protein